MAIINVNLNNRIKKMKPMHGGGLPPSTEFDPMRYISLNGNSICL